MRRLTSIFLMAMTLAACTSTPSAPPSAERPTTPVASPPASSPSAPEAVPARLGDGSRLPSPCDQGPPTPAATVSFVAAGRAWAMTPTGDGLVCLFEASDPGPFIWGPLADRVLLGGLEVEGIDGAPTREAGPVDPALSSWGRPTGNSVVFVSPDGAELVKVHPGSTESEDVTPFRTARYLSVAYHPSGLALTFAVEREGSQSIWISSNTGTSARRLVFSSQGTAFGALAFHEDGTSLLYAAQRSDGHPELHFIRVAERGAAPILWSGPAGRRILDIWPGTDLEDVAFTTGSDCSDVQAMIRVGADDETRPALPNESRPSRALGWLSPETVLVAVGGCGQPLDLMAVDISADTIGSLVYGVTGAAARVPAPTPPPPLPEDTGTGSGFG